MKKNIINKKYKFGLKIVSVMAMLIIACHSGFSQELDLEKEELKFGFIKLTDCAPIVIAKEKGFFEDEG